MSNTMPTTMIKKLTKQKKKEKKNAKHTDRKCHFLSTDRGKGICNCFQKTNFVPLQTNHGIHTDAIYRGAEGKKWSQKMHAECQSNYL